MTRREVPVIKFKIKHQSGQRGGLYGVIKFNRQIK